jgi:CheY-like chemotaxis protein
VVDDDPATLKITDVTLRDLGYRPVCNTDPEDVLRRAEAAPAGIVIVDLSTPGVDGFEFIAGFQDLPCGHSALA